MHKIANNLFVGSGNDCFYQDKPNWAVVHACKDPCHKIGVGYSGSLKPTHPNYLILSKENHLFLNLVDMDVLAHKYTEPIVQAALNFIETKSKAGNVLIHCNQGQSRSPALALLFLAKRAKSIPYNDYLSAKTEFAKLFPNYAPGLGVDSYLRDYWDALS